MVAFDYNSEGVVYRRLDENAVTFACEVINSQAYALDHAGHKSEFVAFYLEVMAVALPVDNRIPVRFGAVRIAQHRMPQALYQGVSNFGAYSEIKVGNPQRGHVVASEYDVELFELGSSCALTIDNTIEIVDSLFHFQCIGGSDLRMYLIFSRDDEVEQVA